MSSYLADLTNSHLWPDTLQGCLRKSFEQANPRKLKLKRVSEYVD